MGSMDTQEEQPIVEAPMKKKKKNMVPQFLAGIFIVVVIALVGVYMYTKSQVSALSEAPFVMSAAQVFHIPIAKIDGHAIPYTDFMMDFSSLKSFYSQQDTGAEPVSEDDISQQVLSRLLINSLMSEYAKKYDVVVEQSDIDAAKAELLSQFPDEETAAQEIQNTFGWSLQTFTDRVIDPIVIEKKVSDAFTTDENVDADYKATQVKASHILFTIDDEHPADEARATAEKVLKRIQDGEDFATLAAEFGSDGTSETGGDLGWIDRGTTVPEFEDVLFSMKAGELYDQIVETQFGLHIVKADDVRTINDFAAFFQEQLKNANVIIYSDIANPFAEVAAPSVNSPEPDTSDVNVQTDENGSQK
ncbi:MAG: hypothetical protein CO030_05030 [Candidatus Magasanikbacteria bacterium CG_4_9_14_0_2_um_filter_42_11]|uniref:PpiC domain-containing protein n=1 Tax=Candidatus Magasanikbacteria bacterium CG_4_9_14_0_2_um_filter_42_11 TaxID=1974643 RepID=A0A2M8F8L4_9BACT|nr:MAG: hypothetical protein COU34_04295 [Candidatus Magasanikbacteria bacterium CG10_big_fil_rev_8_21_14_0_10_43_9]PIY92548.1 MAG: hypothetical protein COY70_02665 [Candidatus Magasanikbacteria bacterium CG_4_10_14_0_8_um_filter_42_12]PJC52019.1 MAG: hypothetical protein CO030_05030 [Candidatus Magasanikbacteria bacterium CG_4_9_14_0_2_um_filter_42_11]